MYLTGKHILNVWTNKGTDEGAMFFYLLAWEYLNIVKGCTSKAHFTLWLILCLYLSYLCFINEQVNWGTIFVIVRHLSLKLTLHWSWVNINVHQWVTRDSHASDMSVPEREVCVSGQWTEYRYIHVVTERRWMWGKCLIHVSLYYFMNARVK